MPESTIPSCNHLLSQMEVIEISDIPSIELYMDQVTTLMEAKLSVYKRNEDDKILTKTMINNYAKAKLFPPPKKKKYGRSHVLLLILIYHLKSVLSINDIYTLLLPINEALEQDEQAPLLYDVYNAFLDIQKTLKTTTAENPLAIETVLQQIQKNRTDENAAILSVLSWALLANSAKRVAEFHLDTRFPKTGKK